MRILLGSLAGGAVLFVWGFLAWTVLPLHDTSGGRLPDEAGVVRALESSNTGDGFYWIPYPENDQDEAALKAFEERHEKGPLVKLVYREKGHPVMEPRLFATGFAIDVAAAFVAAVMLAAAAGSLGYVGRLFFVTGFGLCIAIYVDATWWNFMAYPDDWTIGMMADHVGGWFLAGLVMARIVRKPVK